MMIHKFGTPPDPALDPAKARRRAQRIYDRTFEATLCTWGLATATIWSHATPSVSFWYYNCFFYIFCLTLARIADGLATLACRIAGVSQESRSNESIVRSEGAALAPFLNPAPEFQFGPIAKPQAKADRQEALHHAGAAQAQANKHQTKVDRQGIQHGENHVLWRDVESCAITQHRNAGGHLSTNIKFNGSDGKEMLVLQPCEADAGQLLLAIRFYLRGEDFSPNPAL